MLKMSTDPSRLKRSPKEIFRPIRRSLNTTQGFTPAFRPKLPSSARSVGVPPAAKSPKHGSWKKPVGENLDATAGSPQALGGVPAATTFGRPVSGENWKLSGLPVRMLNGRPDATSIIGAIVQSLKRRLANESPPNLPL